MPVASYSKGALPISVEPRARIELRLVGGPTGAIPLSALGATSHLQSAVLRIAKTLEARGGRQGRSPRRIEDLTRLNAVEIRSGSSVLVLETPADDSQAPFPQLDVGLEALDWLEESLECLGDGVEIPDPVDTLARASIKSFLGAISGYARLDLKDERSGRSPRLVSVVPKQAYIAIGGRDDDLMDRDDVVAVGMLYAVDIKNHSYRLEDDLGRSIAFEFPDDSEHLNAIRSLVGARVEVRGSAIVTTKRGFRDFEVESIEPAYPAGEADYFEFNIDRALADAVRLVALEDLRIPDLTADEAEAFWQAINE